MHQYFQARRRASLPSPLIAAFCVAVLAVGVLAAAERSIYVSVLDEKKAPAEGLTTTDFEVREDGVAREVLRVSKATEPMQIAFLIDDSAAADRPTRDFREGAKAFVNTITAAGKHEIAIITFGERSTLVRDYTSDARALTSSIDRIFARAGAGMELLDALVDASKGLRKREGSLRKHIVVLMTEGAEFGNLHYDTVVEAIQGAGATMHALVLTSITAEDITSDPIRTRNQVLDLGTRTTGGRRDNLLAETSVMGACQSLARELLDQYRVVYSRPDTLIPPERMDVTVKRPGLTARAPTRAGTKS